MSLIDTLLGKKQAEGPNVLPVLPDEIYKTGVLDLQDVIAPHALKVGSQLATLSLLLGDLFLQLLFLTFKLRPVRLGLVEKPEDWPHFGRVHDIRF